jgi:uncharacterized protein (DUF885 family)
MNVFDYSHALIDEWAALRPTIATFMGVPGHDHRWDDFSPAGAAANAAFVSRVRAALAALPPPPDAWHALAADMLTDFCELESERLESGDHLLDFNSIASTFQVLRMVFDMLDAGTAAGRDAAAGRLEGLPGALAGYRALLEEGLAQGTVAAIRQVEAVVRQGRMAAAPEGFFATLGDTLTAGDLATPERDARIRAAVPAARAALTGFCDWLEATYAPAAAPAGRRRPRPLRPLRCGASSGMTPDPEETYAWGWTEVRAILAEMAALAEQIAPGRWAHRSVGSSRRPRRPRPRRGLHRRDAGAPGAGPRRPRRPPLRRPRARAPRRREGAPGHGHRGAYYMQPSEDFSRPGTHLVRALRATGPSPLWDEVSTAYHEGFPGPPPADRDPGALTANLSRCTAWATATRVTPRAGRSTPSSSCASSATTSGPSTTSGCSPTRSCGRCRVVIDIGRTSDLPIPADAPFDARRRDWTFERAVDDDGDTSGGMKRDHAESDVTRYLGWPGAGHLVQGRAAGDARAARRMAVETRR